MSVPLILRNLNTESVGEVLQKSEDTLYTGGFRSMEFGLLNDMGEELDTPIPEYLSTLGRDNDIEADRVEVLRLNPKEGEYSAEYLVNEGRPEDYTMHVMTLTPCVVGISRAMAWYIAKEVIDDDIPEIGDAEQAHMRLNAGRVLSIPEWVKRKFTISFHPADEPALIVKMMKTNPQQVATQGVPLPVDLMKEEYTRRLC